jgi:hypothetical protein
MKKSIYLIFILSLFLGCTKDDKEIIIVNQNAVLPTVETIISNPNNFEQIVYDTYVLEISGNVISDGGKTILDIGLCYSTTGNPDVLGPHKSVGPDYSFNTTLENLEDNTTYYVRAYAANENGVGYGNMITFTTDPTIPIVTISPLESVAASSAVIKSITMPGNHIDERGVCYGTNPNPTISNMTKKRLTGNLYVLDNLQPSTVYYVRGYGKSYGQVGYSQSQSFTTLLTGTSPKDRIGVCDGVQLTTVVPITSITGRVWMDRNLGSSQQENQLWGGHIGGLYQWGRGNDGHAGFVSTEDSVGSGSELINETTNVLSFTDTPNNSFYIDDITDYPHPNFNVVNNKIYLLDDWRATPNDNLWQGVIGINNPCPNGYRLPTLAELEAEMNAYNIVDHITAFNCPLKFPVRMSQIYWTSTINTTEGAYSGSQLLYRGSMAVKIDIYSRTSLAVSRESKGCIRCIKD